MSYGPADLYVVEFAGSAEPAQVTTTLRDVTQAGIITLLDLAVVRVLHDGTHEVLEASACADELGLTGVELAAAGLIGEEDLIELTESTDPDTTTLVVLLENTWARQIAAAVGDADAVVRSVTRFPAEVVNEVAALADDA